MLLLPARGKFIGLMSMSSGAELSRVGEYRDQAAMLRSLAVQTRFAESRMRLLTLADSFDALADRVEGWETSAASAAN
jgi:hypothetical protein